MCVFLIDTVCIHTRINVRVFIKNFDDSPGYRIGARKFLASISFTPNNNDPGTQEQFFPLGATILISRAIAEIVEIVELEKQGGG